MQAKVYRTDKNELVLVFQNANEGWQSCLFRFLTNGKLEFITASKVNLTSEIIKYIDAIFDKQKYMQSTCPVSTFVNMVIEEDVSILMMKTSVLPFLYKDKDVKGVSLSDYIDSISGNANFHPTDLEDDDTYVGLPKKKYDSKKVWASPILDQQNLEQYRVDISDALYAVKQKNAKFQFIVKYLNYINPINPYKNILLSGPAGNGKTTNAEAVAKMYDLPYAALVCDPRMEAESAGGVITVKATDDGSSQWIQNMTNFLKVAKAGGVCNLEEISLADGATQSAWNTMLNGTVRYIVWQGETHFINPDTIFFATRNIGYEGNSPMNFSFKDRFLKIYIPAPSDAEVIEFQSAIFGLPKTTVKEYVKFANKLDNYLFEHHKQDDMYSNERPEVTLRYRNEMLSIFLEHGSVKEPLTELLRGIFDSPSYSDSTVSNIVNTFAADIQALEKILYVNSTVLTEADNVFKKIMGLKHSPSAAKAAASGATKQTKSLADLLTEYSNGTAKNDDDLAGQAKNIFDAFNNVNEGGE